MDIYINGQSYSLRAYQIKDGNQSDFDLSIPKASMLQSLARMTLNKIDPLLENQKNIQKITFQASLLENPDLQIIYNKEDKDQSLLGDLKVLNNTVPFSINNYQAFFESFRKPPSDQKLPRDIPTQADVALLNNILKEEKEQVNEILKQQTENEPINNLIPRNYIENIVESLLFLKNQTKDNLFLFNTFSLLGQVYSKQIQDDSKLVNTLKTEPTKMVVMLDQISQTTTLLKEKYSSVHHTPDKNISSFYWDLVEKAFKASSLEAWDCYRITITSLWNLNQFFALSSDEIQKRISDDAKKASHTWYYNVGSKAWNIGSSLTNKALSFITSEDAQSITRESIKDVFMNLKPQNKKFKEEILPVFNQAIDLFEKDIKGKNTENLLNHFRDFYLLLYWLNFDLSILTREQKAQAETILESLKNLFSNKS